MSYSANVYNVMIASPSDVMEERNAANGIILDWNNVNSNVRRIVLMPVRWEVNSIQTMGDRPQEIINKQLLESADLLIGIFWARLGTPTGKSLSGSVEEIEKHINSGKPAMLYFSNTPAKPDSIDFEQYEAVKKLKKEYQKNGLTETFDSITDFKDKFQRQLSMKINEGSVFSGYDSIDKSSSLGDYKEIDLLISLSNEAKQILLEVSKDSHGTILRTRSSDGLSIQTNNKNFIRSNNPREEALWESSFNELVENQLIRDLGYKGSVFRLTLEGYKIIDNLLSK